MKAFSLPSGTTGFTNDAGQFVCTGSQMGRRSILPPDRLTIAPKLRLVRLPFVDGAYDRWGAYWGGPATVWCAYGETLGVWVSNWDASNVTDDPHQLQVFVRGNTRAEAKRKVAESIPNASFYR